MNRGISLLAVSALFLSGVAIGALGMHLYYANRLAHPGAPPAMASRFFASHLERRLDLSQDQRQAIHEILDDSRREGADLRARLRPDVESLMERTRERIEAVLTPEQRETFDEMRRFERRGIEQLLLGPGPPREWGPRDRGDRWRGRRDPARAAPDSRPPAPHSPTSESAPPPAP